MKFTSGNYFVLSTLIGMCIVIFLTNRFNMQLAQENLDLKKKVKLLTTHKQIMETCVEIHREEAAKLREERDREARLAALRYRMDWFE